ncbi:MAG TPA: translation initiation factor IF-1 [Mycoplasmatales bacterium]|nr:translation initiation factor IF-1 [Mycoplasmatales bacterium]
MGNGNFKVEIHFNEKEKSIIIAYIAGRLRKGSGSFIRIVEGDKVKVEVSSYDTARGRIIYRFSDNIR